MGVWHSGLNKFLINFSNIFSGTILANSHAVRDYVVNYEKFYPKRIEVIHNGINIEKFSLSKVKGNDEFIIGIISNFNRPVKRFDIFIDLVEKIIKKYKNIKFMILGDVDQSLLRSISGDTLSYCHFLGIVSERS